MRTNILSTCNIMKKYLTNTLKHKTQKSTLYDSFTSS